MIRAAWINPETGIVENIIVVQKEDLDQPNIKEIPSEIIKSNWAPEYEALLPVHIGTTKWTDGVGFTDLENNPLTIERLVLEPGTVIDPGREVFDEPSIIKFFRAQGADIKWPI